MSEERKPIVAEIVETARKVVITSTVVCVMGGVAAFTTGAWANMKQLWRLPALVEENQRAIEALRTPTKMFEVSDRSAPVRGFCIEGLPCDFNIRARRVANAISCELVVETLEFFYRDPRKNQVHAVEIFMGRGRNIGTGYINIPFTLSTPFGVTPEAELCVKAEYRNCPGQNADSPNATQEPQCISVEVRGA